MTAPDPTPDVPAAPTMLSGREALLRAGTARFGGEPVLFTEGLRHLEAVAAWRVSGTGWVLMSMGHSSLDLDIYTYEFSGRGFELLLTVEGDAPPSRQAVLLDKLSDAARALASEGSLTRRRRLVGKTELQPSSTLSPLDTANGRVHFVDVVGEAPEARVEPGERLFAAMQQSFSRPAAIGQTADTASASHLGGYASVTNSFEWPQREGAPLSLMLELDLTTLPVDPWLPTTGKLLLFGRHAEADADRFTFLNPFPFALRHVEHAGPPTSQGLEYPRHDLAFEPSSDVPSRPPRDHEVLRGLKAAQRDSALERYDALRGQHRASGSVQVLGWQHSIQDDVAVEIQLRGDEQWPLPKSEYARLEREAEEWLALLQLDSDEHFDFCGGGMLYVLARREDVEARRFDRARAVIQR